MGNFTPFGERKDEVIDPFEKAVGLAQHAEAQARKNKDVTHMLQASTQWLYIAEVHNSIYNDTGKPKRTAGFTGRNDNG
jgi:hypothetical protein